MRRVDRILTKPLQALGAAALFCGLAGCSTIGVDQQKPPAASEGLATKLIMGAANPAPLAPPVDAALKRECPPIDILDGTAAYRVPQGAEPFSVRYQASLADTARECSSLGVEAGIRVGVVGRVILGPKGAPGVVRVPLRIAVVDESNRPLYSQVRSVEVTIPAGRSQAEFSHLEDNIIVPIPENRFRGWRILVGYDPVAPGAKRAP
jgi:hypothetical protein